MADVPEHVERNEAYWDDQAHDYVADGRRNWESEEPTWGVFSVPESEIGMLPAEIEGRDAIELGCGTGYVSAGRARRGAPPARERQQRGAARHRPHLPGGVRPRLPAAQGQRRGGPLPRRLLRHRDLRVRGEHLV